MGAGTRMNNMFLSDVRSGWRLRAKKSCIHLVICTPRYLNSPTYCSGEDGAACATLLSIGKRIDLDQLICIPKKVPNMSNYFRAADSDRPASFKFYKDSFSSRCPTLKPPTVEESLTKSASSSRAKANRAGTTNHVYFVFSDAPNLKSQGKF